MIKLEIFNKKEKKKELYEREDTSVIELEEYWKLQEKIREYINTSDDPKKTTILEMQLKFIVKLFDDKNITIDFLKKNIPSKKLNDTLVSVFREISPEEYEDEDSGDEEAK
ncbi:phage tail assembly chaperone G [Listeria monocytogenes]|uniref:phage tail assembly chaperone G n=1 Tax=Listeria monocytogenes TaxID=1639 RepID=UPI00313D2498